MLASSNDTPVPLKDSQTLRRREIPSVCEHISDHTPSPCALTARLTSYRLIRHQTALQQRFAKPPHSTTLKQRHYRIAGTHTLHIAHDSLADQASSPLPPSHGLPQPLVPHAAVASLSSPPPPRDALGCDTETPSALAPPTPPPAAPHTPRVASGNASLLSPRSTYSPPPPPHPPGAPPYPASRPNQSAPTAVADRTLASLRSDHTHADCAAPHAPAPPHAREYPPPSHTSPDESLANNTDRTECADSTHTA